MSPEQRARIAQRLVGVVGQEPGAPGAARVRDVVLAAKVLIAAERLDLEQDQPARRGESRPVAAGLCQ